VRVSSYYLFFFSDVSDGGPTFEKSPTEVRPRSDIGSQNEKLDVDSVVGAKTMEARDFHLNQTTSVFFDKTSAS